MSPFGKAGAFQVSVMYMSFRTVHFKSVGGFGSEVKNILHVYQYIDSL